MAIHPTSTSSREPLCRSPGFQGSPRQRDESLTPSTRKQHADRKLQEIANQLDKMMHNPSKKVAMDHFPGLEIEKPNVAKPKTCFRPSSLDHYAETHVYDGTVFIGPGHEGLPKRHLETPGVDEALASLRGTAIKSGIVADQTGFGKTRMLLAFLTFIANFAPQGTILLMAPANLQVQWSHETIGFKGFNLVIAYGSQESMPKDLKRYMLDQKPTQRKGPFTIPLTSKVAGSPSITTPEKPKDKKMDKSTSTKRKTTGDPPSGSRSAKSITWQFGNDEDADDGNVLNAFGDLRSAPAEEVSLSFDTELPAFAPGESGAQSDMFDAPAFDGSAHGHGSDASYGHPPRANLPRLDPGFSTPSKTRQPFLKNFADSHALIGSALGMDAEEQNSANQAPKMSKTQCISSATIRQSAKMTIHPTHPSCVPTVRPLEVKSVHLNYSAIQVAEDLLEKIWAAWIVRVLECK
ncbi:hypothetical protein EDD37DRAFT_652802 [Exophiala viscosa]|uniref:uncharacterized protein n=1 Tax=Exophiala viscosa TaxID=2486360 RepID=UPI0021A1B55A|nr:hypothetical protein EDD37DRAFT_652802 [Exophiala viscosa]